MELKSSDQILQFISDCLATHDIHDLMEAAYRYLKNPTLLADVSYNTLDYVGGDDFEDRFWNDYILEGHISEENLMSHMDDGLISSQFVARYPIFIPKIIEHPDGVRRIAVAIPTKTEAHCGWLAIYEHSRPFSQIDLEYASWMSKILSLKLEEISINKIQPLGRIQNLMLDILNRSDTDPALFEKRLRVLGEPIYHYNRTMVLQSFLDIPPFAMQKIISDTLNEHAEHVVTFPYNRYYVAILCSNESDFLESVSTAMSPLLEKYSLWAAVSAPYTSITELRRSFDQAVNCLTVCRKKDIRQRLGFFEDFTLEILIFIASQHLDLREYCRPELFLLEDLDAQQGSEMLDSLRQFVFQNGNLKAAAFELNIHRNTLSNRMEKIQNYLSVKFFSKKLISELYTSFLIYDVLYQSDHYNDL